MVMVAREITVPAERREILQGMLNLLKRRRLIRGFDLGETERVAVVRIGYYKR
jgi:hypothetical protein